MRLPGPLTSNKRLGLDLPSGRTVEIPKPTPTFRKWKGEIPDDAYGGKMMLDADGEPAFAEILILRLLQRARWNGVWIDTFRRTYRQSYWKEESEIELPERVQQSLDTVEKQNGLASGCFDVCAWSDRKILFAEAKRDGYDSIRQTQKE